MTLSLQMLLRHLLLLWALVLGNAFPSVTWGYDEETHRSIAYDQASVLICDNYDIPSTPPINEKATQTLRADRIFSKFGEFLAAKTAARNPNVYEAIFEAPISGASRAAHRNSANNSLANPAKGRCPIGWHV